MRPVLSNVISHINSVRMLLLVYTSLLTLPRVARSHHGILSGRHCSFRLSSVARDGARLVRRQPPLVCISLHRGLCTHTSATTTKNAAWTATGRYYPTLRGSYKSTQADSAIESKVVDATRMLYRGHITSACRAIGNDTRYGHRCVGVFTSVLPAG